MKKATNKEFRFLQVLLSGKTVSRKKARTNYRLQNASATILRFSQMGYKVNREYVMKMTKLPGNKKIPVTTVRYSITM